MTIKETEKQFPSQGSSLAYLYETADLISNSSNQQKPYRRSLQQPTRQNRKNSDKPQGNNTPLVDAAAQQKEKKRQRYGQWIPRKRSNHFNQKESASQSRKEPKLSVSPLDSIVQKLHQENYILAELKEQESAEVKTRDKYDFLKKSQVYNHDTLKKEKEARVAQELNLTHIDD